MLQSLSVHAESCYVTRAKKISCNHLKPDLLPWWCHSTTPEITWQLSPYMEWTVHHTHQWLYPLHLWKSGDTCNALYIIWDCAYLKSVLQVGMGTPENGWERRPIKQLQRVSSCDCLQARKFSNPIHTKLNRPANKRCIQAGWMVYSSKKSV